MRFHDPPARAWAKAFGVGIVHGLLLSAIMVASFNSRVPPLPPPGGLAFAATGLGGPLPLPVPVGLAFHLAYVTFWSMAFVAFLRDSLTLRNALALALALWIGILVVFFPIIGWGFLGLAISPKLIVASLVPHVLFGVFLWGLCRFAFRPA